MPQIDLDNENYAAEVLSYYLWGQKNAPSPSEMRSSRIVIESVNNINFRRGDEEIT